MEPPPPPFDQDEVDSNTRLVELSMGVIPPLRSLKLLSLGSSHTNTGLRQIKAGVVSVVDRLKDSDGQY